MGIFNSAIFNNQVFNTGVEDVGGLPYIDPYSSVYLRRREFEEAEKQRKIKEEEVIRLKLAAQESILKKRELQDKLDKQSLRQLRALEIEYEQLQKDLLYQLAALDKLHKESVKKRNKLITLLLFAACPFTAIN